MWCFCVGKYVGKTPLLILRSVGIFVHRFCRFMSALLVVLRLHLTFSGLAKVAIFTTNVDAENQTLINHKCVCGALNRHFCQTRVTSCPSFCPKLCSSKFALYCCIVWVRWLALSFAFFGLVSAAAKKQM